jgi:hypothetical protein
MKKDKKKKKEKKKPILQNGPKNGAAPTGERFTELEASKMAHLQFEVNSLKNQRNKLREEWLLVSADLIRKNRELASYVAEVVKKYNLKAGEREVTPDGQILKIDRK